MLRIINGGLVMVELYTTENGEVVRIDNRWPRPEIKALNAAIDSGLITEGGKYIIHLTIEHGQEIYNVHPMD